AFTMRYLPLILVLLVAILVFGQAVTHDFVSWDDDGFLYQNPHLNPPTTQSLKLIWTSTYDTELLVPVTYTAWLGLAAVFGHHGPGGVWVVPPGVYHAASLLVHLLTVTAAFFVLLALVGEPWAAAAGAALFALHPLQTEAVAWASELKDLLSGLFGLLTILLFVRFRQGPRRLRLYGLASLTFVLGLLSKPQLVALPLVALTVDWFLLRPQRAKLRPEAPEPPSRAAFWECARWVIPWLGLSLALALFTRHIQPPAPMLTLPLWQRLFITGDTLSFYLSKLFCPLKFTADYGRMPSVVAGHWWGYVTWLFPAALLAGAVALRRRQPWVLPGLLWFSLALLPALGLVPFDFQQYSTPADHYAYFAVCGAALVVAGLATRLRGFYPRVLVLLAFILLASQSGLQTMTWQNSLVFWQHAMEVNPRSFLAHNNLGAMYQLSGQPRKAAEQFELALKIRPDDPDSLANLGMVLAQTNRPAEARGYLEKALQVRPGDPKAQMMLGIIAVGEKDYDTAISRFQPLLDSDPNNVMVRYQLALAFLGQGRKAEAKAHLEEVLRLAPGMEPVQKALRSLNQPPPK
ncbi:MAG: tetratricopeptide repeat protein, partial [Armatimonadota bacterium]